MTAVPTPTLVEFLGARVAEDDQAARAARPGPWKVDREGWSAVEDMDGQLVAAKGFRVVDADAESYSLGGLRMADARHIARHGPARVLAEVQAKCNILDRYLFARDQIVNPLQSETERHTWAMIAQYLEVCVRDLVLPYAEHPECDPSWLPPG
jgi:hypothetical protein